jgi:hypothetical protein
VRAEQTVSEMVVETLARQTEALSERTGQPFKDAFAEVLKIQEAATARKGRRWKRASC